MVVHISVGVSLFLRMVVIVGVLSASLDEWEGTKKISFHRGY